MRANTNCYMDAFLFDKLADNPSLNSAYNTIEKIKDSESKWQLNLKHEIQQKHYILFFTKDLLYPFVLAQYTTKERKQQEIEDIIIMDMEVATTVNFIFHTNSAENTEKKKPKFGGIRFDNLKFQYPNISLTPTKYDTNKHSSTSSPILMYEMVSFQFSFEQNESDIENGHKATIQINSKQYDFYFTCTLNKITIHDWGV